MITSNRSADRPLSQRGPALGPLALVCLLLLLAGLATSAALGGVPPSPYDSATAISSYFATRSGAVTAGAFFLFGSSVPLGIYAATVSSRLRSLGVTAPGSTIALVGGVICSAMVALSALISWTLAQRSTRTGGLPLVRALHDLSFLTGGVAFAVFLGLLVAGVAVPGLLVGLLPRAVAWTGLVIAVVCEISSLSLLWEPLIFLLPVARFPGLIWLTAAGFMLPVTRRPRNREAPARVRVPGQADGPTQARRSPVSGRGRRGPARPPE